MVSKPKKNLDVKKRDVRYANYLEVGYNAFEFILDFGQDFAENEEAELCTRIVTSPGHAKIMLKTLQKALEKFERDFGSDPP